MSTVSKEFAAVMLGIAEVFRATLTEQRIKLYAQALSDLSQEQVESAAARAIRECRYFPTPRELREFVESVGDDRALLAWSGFQRAARSVGAWASLVVDDVCAAEALESVFGCWPLYCELEGAAVGARRAEFVAAYRAAQRVPRAAVANVTLAGWCEVGWVGLLTADGEVRRLPSAAQATRRALPEAGEA